MAIRNLDPRLKLWSGHHCLQPSQRPVQREGAPVWKGGNLEMMERQLIKSHTEDVNGDLLPRPQHRYLGKTAMALKEF